MNNHLNFKHLPLFTAALGIAAFAARLGLFRLGVDEKGLLIPGHPMDLLVWVITAAAAALILPGVVRLRGSDNYGRNFTPSLTAALGAFALAAGVGLSVGSGWGSFQRIDQIRDIFGLEGTPVRITIRQKGDKEEE